MKCNSAFGFVLFMTTALSVSAAPIVYTAALGNFEDPPTGSPGTGTAIVTIDPVANTMSVEATFANLLGNVTASHIHVINGPGDSNTTDTLGPVATTTPSFPGFPVGVTSGSYNQVFDMTLASSYRAGFIVDSGGTPANAQAALFAAIQDGRAYFNIHTAQFPGGEIRQFLQPVPEPGTYALVASALGALVLIRRKRC